jgi:transcriptional repressor NrdR
MEMVLPRLVKRDGQCVQFREEKLRSGILRALEKRPIGIEQVDQVVQRIVGKLRTCGDPEIETRRLGEWVMVELRNLDEVAYVRFASVYRRFQDVSEFYEEVRQLQQETPLS